MGFDKLTPQEQAFAAENHGLLIRFMESYHLDEELYGSLSLRYLKTVHRYLTDPNMRRYRFSTILWLNLRSELSHELRRSSRMPVLFPLDEEHSSGVYDAANGTDELWQDLKRILSEQELELLRQRILGKSYSEIGRLLNLTKKAVDGRLYRLRKKIRKL